MPVWLPNWRVSQSAPPGQPLSSVPGNHAGWLVEWLVTEELA